jgi:trk system potassium uptake protein TrkH
MAPRGQASVSWIARPAAVCRILLGHSTVVFAVLTPPFAVAVVEGAYGVAAGLLPGIAVCLLCALLAWRLPPADDVRHIEAVTTLTALFIIVSILPVPAFQALGMPAIDAFFESVSGITSTGLTVARDTMEWPFAGHFLRAWMQWSGGFAIAVAGVALILRPGAAAHEMAQVGVDGRDLLSSMRAQARQMLVAYCLLTALAIGLLVLLLPNAWEGVVVALTAVSTGGFTPRADSLMSYSRAAQVAVLGVGLSTTVSLFFYVLIVQKGPRKALRQSNAVPVLVALTLGALLVGGAELATEGWHPDDVLEATLNFISGFTTAGFSVAPIDDTRALLALLLMAMLVGGGVGSTAGGIKLDRALTLARAVALSVLRLRAPRRAVIQLRENGQRRRADDLIGIAAIIALYLTSAFLCWLAFLASGMPPLPALFDIVSALSTVGLSTGVVGPDLSGHLKAVLVIAMLAGRLEFLALLVFLLPGTWIRRS